MNKYSKAGGSAQDRKLRCLLFRIIACGRRRSPSSMALACSSPLHVNLCASVLDLPLFSTSLFLSMQLHPPSLGCFFGANTSSGCTGAVAETWPSLGAVPIAAPPDDALPQGLRALAEQAFPRLQCQCPGRCFFRFASDMIPRHPGCYVDLLGVSLRFSMVQRARLPWRGAATPPRPW